MLNRKGTMFAPPTFGFSRASNEGAFLRRVSALTEESKRQPSDEATSSDWNVLDTTLRGVFRSADNLHVHNANANNAETCSTSANIANTHHHSSTFMHVTPAASSFHYLDSPKSSPMGNPSRCTGGGTGEAGPSSSGGGGCSRLITGCDPAGAPLPLSLSPPARKSVQTPLARHLAERNLLSRSVRTSAAQYDGPTQLRSRDVAPGLHQPPPPPQQQQQQQPPLSPPLPPPPPSSAASPPPPSFFPSGPARTSSPSSSSSSNLLIPTPTSTTSTTTTTTTTLTPSSSASSSNRALSYASYSSIEKLPSFFRTSSSIHAAAAAAAAAEAAAAAAGAGNGAAIGALGSSSRLPDPSLPHSSYGGSGSGLGGVTIPWIGMNGTNGKEVGAATAAAAAAASSVANGGVSRSLTPITGVTSARPNRHVLTGVRQLRNGNSGPFAFVSEGYLDPPVTFRPRASTGSIPLAAKQQLQQQQQQQQQLHPQPPLATPAAPAPAPAAPPSFTPRPSPIQGLIHMWASAPPAMRRGEWAMSQYGIARQLYGGYASSVFKAKCLRSGQDVVLKVYSLSSLSDFLRNQVLRELDIHSRLDHPHVVQLLAAFREGDKLVLVLEYVRGGSLDRARRKLGGRMSEQQALELVLVPLLRTLHYLHTRAIVHRDIKPENLLFTSDWKLKMCDYGVSVCLSEERAVTRTGSKDYMAPEVQVCPLKRTAEDNKSNAQLAYGPSADIWSLGVLTYELLVGFTPFPGGPPPLDDCGPTACRRLPTFPSAISADARAFVVACLADAAVDRPTIYELLKHRWVHSSMV